MRLDDRRVARFVRATHAGGIPSLAEGPLLPPTYGATWETALALEVLAAAGYGLPTSGLIHLQSELVQVRSVQRDDLIGCRLELEGAEENSRGTLLTLRGRCWSGAGQLCSESTTSLLLRSSGSGRRGGEKRANARARRAGARNGEDDGLWTELLRWKLGGGAGRRYARASGDFNPIHLSALTARPLGFRRPILHGFCLEAMVAHALIERLLGGSPGALRRLRISFRAPLPLPSSPRLMIDEPQSEAPGRFRVIDDAEGATLYAEGEWVGRREGPTRVG